MKRFYRRYGFTLVCLLAITLMLYDRYWFGAMWPLVTLVFDKYSEHQEAVIDAQQRVIAAQRTAFEQLAGRP